ncbi:MAG: class A beta-lactamase-related serine hydrolase [Bryobacterales bacterium]|nr:class A beta-lactamase-related serine hydrolase [Bryobacterales bacterium]
MTRRFAILTLLPLTLLAQLPPEKLKQIEQAISTEMSRNSIPGLSAAVATGSTLRWAAGFGTADLENLVPVTASTVIRLGSISKPITAVAVLQLVESGKIDLDASIERYVPSMPAKPWPVTVRQLLGHLGGIRHYGGPEELDSTRHYTDRITPLKIFQSDPLFAEPGTKYHYTSYGFNLLGAAVETASGMRFTDYIRDRIFKPARMDRIGADDVYAIIPHRARGYRLSASKQVENCSLADTSNKIPGGGLSSTASDLVKFALAARSGQLLKDEIVRVMWTSQKLRDGKPTSYGMGWTSGQFEGRVAVGHGGGQQGATTYLQMLPDQGIAFALMANLESARLNDMRDRIARILLELD